MPISILPNGETTFLSDDGTPLALGTVDFYIPGTTTRKNTWQDSNSATLNANPVVLDAAGRAIIWGSGSYRQIVKDADGNVVWDQVTSEWGASVAALQAEIDIIDAEIISLSAQISNSTGLINTQTFNTEGDHTYTPTLGTVAVVALIQAGGGGSQGVTGPGASKVSIGGGGEGGEWIQTPLITSPLVGQTLHVGAGGAPGATGPNAGGNGGNSSAFGYTAIGGAGGTGSQQAVTPPAVATIASGRAQGSTGAAERPGGPSGNQLTQSVALASSGSGGSSNYSPGAPSATCGTDARASGIGPTGAGGGASGAVSSGTGGAAPGATGGVGQILVMEYGSIPGGTSGSGSGAATQTDEESGTLTTVYTNPAVQQYHDSALKVAGYIGADGTILDGYNIASVTHTPGSGVYVVNFTEPFATANYSAVVTARGGNAPFAHADITVGSETTTSIEVVTALGLSTPDVDDAPFSIMCAGRRAGGAYTAGAVHFDGSTYLSMASALTGVADSPFFSMSFWIRIASGADLPGFILSMYVNGSDYIDNTYISFDSIRASLAQVNYAAPGGGGADRWSFSSDPDTIQVDSTWVNILMSVATNFPTGSKIGKIYINDAGPFEYFASDGGAGSFDIGWAAATNNVTIGADVAGGTPLLADMADFWFAPGQFIDFTVEANRRKFATAGGSPVYLGTDGSIPTGTAPAVFFTGNASTFGTNAGTGGTFSTTGTLTNASSPPT